MYGNILEINVNKPVVIFQGDEWCSATQPRDHGYIFHHSRASSANSGRQKVCLIAERMLAVWNFVNDSFSGVLGRRWLWRHLKLVLLSHLILGRCALTQQLEFWRFHEIIHPEYSFTQIAQASCRVQCHGFAWSQNILLNWVSPAFPDAAESLAQCLSPTTTSPCSPRRLSWAASLCDGRQYTNSARAFVGWTMLSPHRLAHPSRPACATKEMSSLCFHHWSCINSVGGIQSQSCYCTTVSSCSPAGLAENGGFFALAQP